MDRGQSSTCAPQQLKQAWLELGQGEDPADWKSVAVPIREPVRSGVIQTVDPRELAGANQWTLRLIVEHANGSRRVGLLRMPQSG